MRTDGPPDSGRVCREKFHGCFVEVTSSAPTQLHKSKITRHVEYLSPDFVKARECLGGVRPSRHDSCPPTTELSEQHALCLLVDMSEARTSCGLAQVVLVFPSRTALR